MGVDHKNGWVCAVRRGRRMGVKRAKPPGKSDLRCRVELVLLPEDQHAAVEEGLVDGQERTVVNRFVQVDTKNLGPEHRRQRANIHLRMISQHICLDPLRVGADIRPLALTDMSNTSPKHFPALKAKLPSMDGKSVLVTGTTSGTGKVAANTMAELGAKVLVLNRPSSRSEASFSELEAANPSAELHSVECDLQSFSSVRGAAATVAELCTDGVDVLCNNAGVMALGDIGTVDGFDVQMQTNHLSHFLLTAQLMPLIEQAAASAGDARIVNHSSVARLSPSKTLHADHLEQRGGALGGDGSSLQNLMFRGPRWLRYNQSKLANAAFTAALHHRLQQRGSSVRALVAHPGLANTHLQQTSVKEGGMGAAFTNLMMRFSQSPEDGAMGIISCMALPDAKSGQFYGPGSGTAAFSGEAKPFALESFYDNAETRDLLWSKSEAAIDQKFDL